MFFDLSEVIFRLNIDAGTGAAGWYDCGFHAERKKHSLMHFHDMASSNLLSFFNLSGCCAFESGGDDQREVQIMESMLSKSCFSETILHIDTKHSAGFFDSLACFGMVCNHTFARNSPFSDVQSLSSAHGIPCIKT